MAFVKMIKDGKSPIKVAESSVSKFESAGWRRAKNNKSVKQETEGDSEVTDEVEEKSVDEMTADELQKKAEELGVDVSRANTIGALRKAIKRALAQ